MAKKESQNFNPSEGYRNEEATAPTKEKKSKNLLASLGCHKPESCTDS